MDEKLLGQSSSITANTSVDAKTKSSFMNGTDNENPNGANGHNIATPSPSRTVRNTSSVPSESNNEPNDDVGWWNCSLCTYKNSADRFKCEICDLKRGSSTRKPRCNADTIVAQVVRQQEQIRQQTRATKPTPKSRPPNTINLGSPATQATSSNQPQQNSKKSKTSRSINLTKNQDTHDNTDEDSEMNTAGSPKTKRKKTSKKRDELSSTHGGDVTDVESTDVSDESSGSLSNPSSSAEDSESISDNSDAESSPEHETEASEVHTHADSESSPRVVPLEVNGGLIKYSPPTTSGRTGLIIDKKRFTQHSVTVDDVTITFTEFATRRNNYVRKKKRRRDRSH